MKILVVGSTGMLGQETARQLAAGGHEVSGLVRTTSDPSTVDRLRGWGVTTVLGDLKDPPSLVAACAGADAVVTTASALGSETPEDTLVAVDEQGQKALVDAAAAAGVGRLVYVSVLGIRADSPFTAAKLAVEEHLEAASIDHTILQPSIFMDVWFSPHVGFDWMGGQATIYGDGTAPMAWLAIADVASVIGAVVSDPAFANTTVPVLGPEALTPAAAVAAFERVTGTTFKTENVPAEALEAQRAAAENPVEQSFASLMLRYAAGDPAAATMPAGLPAPATTVEAFARALAESA